MPESEEVNLFLLDDHLMQSNYQQEEKVCLHETMLLRCRSDWGGMILQMAKFTLMSRNAGSGENGDFGEILSVNLTIFMQITLTEMDLTCWRIWRIWRFLCKLHVGEFEDHQRWA